MIRYLKNATLTYSTQLITLIISFLINIVIVRMLGPSGKGIIALLQSYFSILVVIFIFGMSEGNVYYLGNRRYSHGDVFSNIIVHTIVISIILVLLSIFLRKWISTSFLKNISGEYYFIATWLFPAFFFFLHITTMLLGHKNIIGYNVTMLSRFLLILIFLIILIPRYNITGALIAIIAGFIAADIIGTFLLTKYGFPKLSINFNFLKDTALFGAKSQVGIILNQIDRRFDIFIINLFLNPAQVGFYAVGVAVGELPWHISNAFATVLFPEVSGMEKKEAYKFTAFICRNAFIIVLGLSATLFLIGGFLIKAVFGYQFSASVTPLKFLLPGVTILSINRVLCAGFSGTGRPEYSTYTVVLSALATIILDVLFIPLMGIKGAAIASSVAYTLSTIVGITLFKRISGFPLREFLIINREDIRKYPVLLSKFLKKLSLA